MPAEVEPPPFLANNVHEYDVGSVFSGLSTWHIDSPLGYHRSVPRTRCRPSTNPIRPCRDRTVFDNAQRHTTSHTTSPSSRMFRRRMFRSTGISQTTRRRSKCTERLLMERVCRNEQQRIIEYHTDRHSRHSSSLQGPAHTLLCSYALADHLHFALDHPHLVVICIPNLGIHLPALLGQIALLSPVLCVLASRIRCRLGLGSAETEREEVDRQAAQKEGMAGAKY